MARGPSVLVAVHRRQRLGGRIPPQNRRATAGRSAAASSPCSTGGRAGKSLLLCRFHRLPVAPRGVRLTRRRITAARNTRDHLEFRIYRGDRWPGWHAAGRSARSPVLEQCDADSAHRSGCPGTSSCRNRGEARTHVAGLRRRAMGDPRRAGTRRADWGNPQWPSERLVRRQRRSLDRPRRRSRR